jgi:hypothetical protein
MRDFEDRICDLEFVDMGLAFEVARRSGVAERRSG